MYEIVVVPHKCYQNDLPKNHNYRPAPFEAAQTGQYSVLDVKLTTKSGNVICIEIQVLPIPDMITRVIYGQSKMITEQIKSGDKWGVINRVVTILITDHDFMKDSNRYYEQLRYRTKDGLELTNLTEINILDLTKIPTNGNSDLWYWARFIKSGDDEETLKDVAERSPMMGKAVGYLKELSRDERARMLYDEHEKAKRDEMSRMDGARRDGITDVAKKLLFMGLSVEQIMEATELSRKDIERIM